MATKQFQGLNNVSDPLRLGLDWFVLAENVNITDTGGVVTRPGYTQLLAGAFTAAYSTLDFTRMYVVEGGSLKTVRGLPTLVTLASGLSSAPMFWTEINGQVFFNNGVDSGIIGLDDAVLPWRWSLPPTPVVQAVTGDLAAGSYRVCCTSLLSDGRTTGAGEFATLELMEGQGLQVTGVAATDTIFVAPAGSTVFQRLGRGPTQTWQKSRDVLGMELQSPFNEALPIGVTAVQAWRGRLCAAQYFAAQGQSAVWLSQPLGFHLFDPSRDVFFVPGQVLMLAPADDGETLLIGTDQSVLTYDGKVLKELACYGVAPGQHWADDKGRTLFWTARGLCSVMPFTNLTEDQVSVPPGLEVGGVVMLDEGQKRYIAVTKQGGSAFNSRS